MIRRPKPTETGKMLKPLRIASVGLAMVLATSVASAEDEPPPYPACTKQTAEADTNAAKGAFAAGQAAYNEGDYERAITYWSDAYRRDCTAHALLRNLATAYELSGKRKHALLSLRTYLERQPDSPSSTQIKTKIQGLERRIAADAAAAQPGTEPPPVAEDPVDPRPPVVDDPPPDEGGSRPFYPLIVAGAGGVLTAAGAAMFFSNSADLDSLEKQGEREFGCMGRNCPPGTPDGFLSQANDARKKTSIGGGLAIGGLAVLGGGLAWYFLQPKSGGDSAAVSKRPRVSAAVTPRFAGVSLSGNF